MKAFGDFLAPDELQFLQDCLDSILEANKMRRDSAEGEASASALINAWRRGVRDRDTLISLADMSGAIAALNRGQGRDQSGQA